MAQFYLLNVVRTQGIVYLPGALIDDSVTPTTPITAIGGVLWPESDATVQAQAALVSAAHSQRGMNETDMQFLMFAAAHASELAQIDTIDTNVATNTASITTLNTEVASVTGLAIVRVTTAIPLVTIQAQTSGTAFNVGAVLPTNARVLAAEINVATAVSGGSLSAVTATLQGGTDTAGSMIASSSVFTGAKPIIATPGSDPYTSRGGQQLKMTLTSTSDTLANATAGVLSVDVFYAVIP